MRNFFILLFLFLFSREKLLSQVWYLKNGDTVPTGHGIVKLESYPNKTEIRIRCCATVTDRQPFFIVDGIVYDLKKLSELNPSDIESITVLKAVQATALYGYEGANGVVIIATKSSMLRKFIVKDFLDGSRIAGATVSFISSDKKDTIMMAANDSGIIVINKLKTGFEYQMRSSAVGYKTYSSIFKNNYGCRENEIFMERNIKNFTEVVIANTSYPRKKVVCGYTISCTKISYNNNEMNISNVFKIYPNPVSSGASLTIEWKQSESGDYTLQLLNLPGQVIFSKQMFIDDEARALNLQLPRVAAGNYFLRMTNSRSRKAFTGKIIVQ